MACCRDDPVGADCSEIFGSFRAAVEAAGAFDLLADEPRRDNADISARNGLACSAELSPGLTGNQVLLDTAYCECADRS